MGGCSPAGPFEELSEQCIGLLRAVCDQEPGPSEVAWIRLEEVRKLIKLDQFGRHGFCRIYLFLIEDEIIMPFQRLFTPISTHLLVTFALFTSSFRFMISGPIDLSTPVS